MSYISISKIGTQDLFWGCPTLVSHKPAMGSQQPALGAVLSRPPLKHPLTRWSSCGRSPVPTQSGGRTFGPPWGSVSPSLPGSQTVHLQRHALEPGTWGTGRGQRAGRDMWRTKEPGPPPRASDPSRRPQSHWPWGQRTPIPMRPWEEEIPNPISFWEAGT